MKKYDRVKTIVWWLSLTFVIAICASMVGCSVKNDEVKFHENLNHLDEAYVDIVALVPQYTIGSGVSSSQIICKCRTSENTIMWMCMFIDEYEELFAKETSLSNGMFADVQSVKLTSIRVHGRVYDAEDISNGLSDKIGTPILLRYGSASEEEFDHSGANFEEPIAFSQDVSDLSRVYTNIDGVEIVFTFYNNLRDPLHTTPTSYICQGQGTDGNTVWIYVDAEKYTELCSGLIAAMNTTGESFSVRIFGFSRIGNEIVNDLVEDIGVEKVIHYEYIE